MATRVSADNLIRRQGKPMGLFTKSRPEPRLQERAVQKRPVIEGWSDNDVVSVYTAAPVRHLRKGEALFTDMEYTDSFFILLDGSFQVVVKWDGHQGRP